MYEHLLEGRRFSDRAQNLLVYQARRVADRQECAYIGTEHLLLGILYAKLPGVAENVLRNLGVTLDAVQSAIEPLAAAGPMAPLKEQQTDTVETVVRQANDQAKQLGHYYLGTEHLLLALLAIEPETRAAQVLHAVDSSISYQRVRQEILRLLGHESDEVPGKSRAQPVRSSANVPAHYFYLVKNLHSGKVKVWLGFEGVNVLDDVKAAFGPGPWAVIDRCEALVPVRSPESQFRLIFTLGQRHPDIVLE